jgi:hypothetical protein
MRCSLFFFLHFCKTTPKKDDDGIMCRHCLVRSKTKGQKNDGIIIVILFVPKDDGTIAVIFFLTKEKKRRRW